MEDGLEELYQEIILEHNKHPRHKGAMANATAVAEGDNPLCGDELRVFVKLDGAREKIEEIRFEGSGCAISQASASLMTEALQGKTVAQAQAEIRRIFALLTGEEAPQDVSLETYGDLAALKGVRQFPQRIKCATLAWHALQAALNGEKAVTTES